MVGNRLGFGRTVLVLFGLFWCSAYSESAYAVPAYAEQTTQPCIACHVGGFGPQLTPFGREFKLEGYTLRGTDEFTLPVSAAAIASYMQTNANQATPPAPHYGTNDNFTLDQANIFIAGGFGDHFGSFAQFTYDGVGRSFSWDNLDLRATDRIKLFGQSAVIGLSVNNNPGVQDPWNTMAAWGFPYTSSALAPAPSSGTLLDGALAQSVLGTSAYGWWNSDFYTEAAVYWTPGLGFLNAVGVNPDDGVGVLAGAAPYFRVGYEERDREQNYHVGGFAFFADIYPGGDQTTGTSDHYADLGVDAGYQFTGLGQDIFSINAIYTHEDQKLDASALLGASNPKDSLDEIRTDVSYYWQNLIGGTVQYFNIWGTADPLLYASNSTLKPNSNGFVLQLDATPFGTNPSPLGYRLNVRVGVQYWIYTEFNGAVTNFDGMGRNASDNNTLRVFVWFAF
jgi:hypothetical protein